MLVLASRSPRRAELLRAAGFEFLVRAEEIDESIRDAEAPEEYVRRLAFEKAHAIPSFHHEIVLAADTTVVLGNEILAKPKDDGDAVRMLRALSGERHEVLTGICVRRGKDFLQGHATTSVWFARMSEAEVSQYVGSGEPRDKAGAYGIQGLASKFVERIEGSYTNVVGLPISLVYQLLNRFKDGDSEPASED